MIRKLLFSASLAGMLLLGVSMRAHPVSAQNQSQQKQPDQATKSTSGKVTSIGNAGQSFAIEVNNGDSKSTMQFVIDKNTQVQGQV